MLDPKKLISTVELPVMRYFHLIMIHFAYCSKQDHSLVAVLDPQSQQLLQPVFRFPQYVNLPMISFHAHTHVIFVYGSEVSKYETLSKYMVIRT